MTDQLGVTQAELAHIDTGYLAAYSLGQFLWGFAADKVGARRVIGFGMLASAACLFWFGLSTAVWMLMAAYALNGLMQATGWSANVRVMTAHFPARGRGTTMGFWTTNYVVGGLVAAPIAAIFLAGLYWRQAFFGPAAILAALGVAVFMALPRDTPSREPRAVAVADEERRVARRRLLRTPLLWALGSAYVFMKLTRYVLLFWLIYYMEKVLGFSNWHATTVSLAFEISGAIGAISVGWASERWFRARRVPIAVASLVLLAVALAAYGPASQHGPIANVLVLAVVGFFLFGPDALVSATAAQDLGGPAAAATAAGIINGMGSVGPVFGSEIAHALTTRFGWSTFYVILGAGALVSAVILVPFWRIGRPGAAGADAGGASGASGASGGAGASDASE